MSEYTHILYKEDGTPIFFGWNKTFDTVEISYPKIPDGNEIEVPGWMLLEFVGRYLNGQAQEMLENMSGKEFLGFLSGGAV